MNGDGVKGRKREACAFTSGTVAHDNTCLRNLLCDTRGRVLQVTHTMVIVDASQIDEFVDYVTATLFDRVQPSAQSYIDALVTAEARSQFRKKIHTDLTTTLVRGDETLRRTFLHMVKMKRVSKFWNNWMIQYSQENTACDTGRR